MRGMYAFVVILTERWNVRMAYFRIQITHRRWKFINTHDFYIFRQKMFLKLSPNMNGSTEKAEDSINC